MAHTIEESIDLNSLKLQQLGAEIEFPAIFGFVPWRHHVEILEQFIQYLIFEKKSIQAAQNVLDDYDATLNHRYFMMYRIVNDIVFVDNIFHELQDYGKKMN